MLFRDLILRSVATSLYYYYNTDDIVGGAGGQLTDVCSAWLALFDEPREPRDRTGQISNKIKHRAKKEKKKDTAGSTI